MTSPIEGREYSKRGSLKGVRVLDWRRRCPTLAYIEIGTTRQGLLFVHQILGPSNHWAIPAGCEKKSPNLNYKVRSVNEVKRGLSEIVLSYFIASTLYIYVKKHVFNQV